MNVILMASGSGTNAINLIKHAQKLKKVKIVGLIVDKPNSPLNHIQIDVPVFLIPKLKSDTSKDHETHVIEKIKSLQGDWILLCGYMRILTPHFLKSFYDPQLNKYRIINIHPSLLPKYKGSQAYLDAFNAGETQSGVTVHYVNEELDAGEILFQESFPRDQNDTFDSFVQKGKALEWKLYPQFLDWLENQ